jgi:hypothetical protein
LFGLELAQVLFDKMSQRAGLQTKEHKHACQGLVEVDADGVVLDLAEVNLDVRQACKIVVLLSFQVEGRNRCMLCFFHDRNEPLLCFLVI